MFEFLDVFNFGRKIEAHKQEWLSIKYLRDGLHFAVKPNDELPCQIFLVKEDKQKKGEELK